MTMRAVTYSRFSSDQQNPASAADQTAACRRYAQAQGWQVVGCYEDAALSGASAQRPGFQRLVQDAKAGIFDVVVTEALDRLGRKLSDVAKLHDQLTFLGIRIHSVQQGVITEMHIGLLGTMSQLFLSDLRAKTRRGLRAVAEDGRSAGGLSYGYRIVPGEHGERGRRAIDAAQAAVVVRIFEQYAAGLSPRRIAMALNAEGIPGPRGGAWTPSAINGNRRAGTGIMNNEAYRGTLAWGKRHWVKDPETGRRLARQAAASEKVTQQRPELRIVDDALWEAAKARQAALDAKGDSVAADAAATNGARDGQGQQRVFWSKQRPRYLFSGLMACGECGGGFSKISVSHFGCSTARNKGPTGCSNRLTVRRDVLEETVLGALRDRLMDPELFRVFVEEFRLAWNRLQAGVSAELEGKRAELGRLGQQIERAVDAVLNGMASPTLRERLERLEGRKADLEREIANTPVAAPRLHPNLATLYRQRMTELTNTLASDEAVAEREVVRGLVELIRLVPEGGTQRIEVRGALGAILALAEDALLGSAGRNAENPGSVAEAFLSQIKRDAGTRNRRCQYIEVYV